MKSWAAENSSDEDSEFDLRQRPDLSTELFNTKSIDTDLSYDNTTIQGATSPKSDDDVEYTPVPPPVDFGHVPPNAPNMAPFTAHIGNLSFGVKEGSELATEVERLVKERYNGDESVVVTEARVGVDRATGKRRGYGYVEFDSLEELLILLNLNDGYSVIAGRMVRIDIAQPRRDRPPMRTNSRNHSRDRERYPPNKIDVPSIDGNQFRGGIRRMDSAGSGSGGAMATRPTLKLAPRSKPLSENMSAGVSNIFGGARPREEVVKERQQQVRSVPDTGSDNKKRGEGKGAVRETIEPRHNGGRSGRGAVGGRGGRRGGRGRGDRVKEDASSHGIGDTSSRTSSHGTGDTSGRGGQGGARTNKRRNARTRTTVKEGGGVWNKNLTSPSKAVPPSPPVEVLIPSEKNVTKVANPYSALVGDDSDSE